MKRSCTNVLLAWVFLAFVSAIAPSVAAPSAATLPADDAPFAIRGVLPWHNFLCGPTAWNEEDYRVYLDRMKQAGLNLIAFHNYTGGEQRYVTYVEPMIRIRFRDITPQAFFDTSLTARWGYRPLRVAEFAFETDKLFKLPPGAEAFGTDCGVTARTTAEHYDKAQALMRRVLEMAHQRGIRFAMGFEFGIHPPEFHSIVPYGQRLTTSGLLDPTSPSAIELLRNTIDDLLAAYPGIDQVWLWLHEHTMFVAEARFSPAFARLMKEEGERFPPAGRFNGVWSLAYLRQAHAYLKQKAPNVTVVVSGWGGQDQMAGVLTGLHAALPREIVFSCLNPAGGAQPHADVLSEIAKTRPAWSIPWLEQDGAMWHLQPRVGLTLASVRKARTDGLQGVAAIHWRTEDVRQNFEAFALAAGRPLSAGTAEQFYADFCRREYGPAAVPALSDALAKTERDDTFAANSPEFDPYDPTHWGRVGAGSRRKLQDLVALVGSIQARTTDPAARANLDWLADNLSFFLDFDQVSRQLLPAYDLRNRFLTGQVAAKDLPREAAAAGQALSKARIEQFFRTYAHRVRSRGELGVLSSMNQRVWLQYRELKRFVDSAGK